MQLSSSQPLRALKMNGGVAKDAHRGKCGGSSAGFANLKRHVENIRKFGVPAVVAINEFVSDTEAEIAALKELCASIDVPVELAGVWADGAEGEWRLLKRLFRLLLKIHPTILAYMTTTFLSKKRLKRLSLKSTVVAK